MREKVEKEFEELEIKLKKEIGEKFEELKSKVREASRLESR
ncbi:MAG: hypothetical protein NZ929_04555 [Aigarchaeota archaeon]|nr:hypothetical protein [Aigarchaeota archaeon]MCX8193539.1 hypothetical protein [Nitrososphaeria archaeon]MDW7986679.1 hypothetical protein [Nitrososphaerota archaeon]